MKLYLPCLLIIPALIFAQSGVSGSKKKKLNVAVQELEGEGIKESELQTLTTKLRGKLLRTGKFSVIERGQMKAILEEQEFQQSDCASQECAVEMGQLLGVERIIAGSIGKIDNTYLVSVRMIDVEKGNIIKHVDEEVTGSLMDVMKVGIHNVAWKMAGLEVGLLKMKEKSGSKGSAGAPSKQDKTTVWFVGLPIIDHLYLDLGTRMLIGGEKKDRMKKSLTAISPGRHLMHYDRAVSVRYYHEFECREGENYIEPNFKEHRLPSLSRHFSWSKDKGSNRIEAKKTAEYFTYDKGLVKRSNKAEIRFSIAIEEQSGASDRLIFTYRWKVVLNGTTIGEDSITETRSAKKAGTHRKKVVIWSDDYHYYSVKYYIIRHSTELEVRAGFIDYKDK